MKEKDVKILWGRSGNRCAICKIELTPVGSKSVLGEMAHIIADSLQGPRGDSHLISEQRNEYDNLILLCPTHHTLIDKNEEEWTIEKLRIIKSEHENWVSNQLSHNNISISSIDNSNFIESREKSWISFSGNKLWFITSFTPLHIYEDSIDPLTPDLYNLINSLRLPEFNGYSMFSDNLNQYNTVPNEYGIINQELPNEGQNKLGHRIQVFRNGHCEFLMCLEYLRTGRDNSSNDILIYNDMRNSFIAQIEGILNIWSKSLPFNDMLLTLMMTNTTCIRLHSGQRIYNGDLLGQPVTSPTLKYSRVINKTEKLQFLQDLVIKRFVNYFGLNINSVFAENGNMNLPNILYF
ncbi:HNH endonuclease signature motif containing protein [Anabaena sp. UHCC 0399]|uniref:HNH endonuclease signature motif containing protein n=1 Tax=Anabaena sp. UHCC 0399 TaxID=3110238 RepID=UPI002B2081CE|nr:HNH endonuclease signature motif containing protein [Anabaena sp. UHCC 0399]MEA5566334.1 HNH endonuclease signature motif containing protein [Anabaena sp. UHCC 0399]